MTRKILILGATGRTGRHVLSKALAAGSAVTVLVRDTTRLGPEAPRLRVIVGDVTADGPALADAVRGQDAVISTLGSRDSLKSGDLFAKALPALVRAMNHEGVKRLIVMSAFGVGTTRTDLPLLPKLVIAVLLRDLYADKARGQVAVEASDLDWTIVYPSGLTDRPGTSQYRVGEHLSLRGFPTIPRADVADFLLRQLDESAYIRRGVMISA